MATMPEKLKDLTPSMYFTYKRKRFTDKEIYRMFDSNENCFTKWKHIHGLIGNFNIRLWDTWDKFFPEEVEKLKKKFIKYHNMGWKRDYIAEEMDMSTGALTRFVNRYLPQYKACEISLHLTVKEKRLCRKNGLKVSTVLWRIRSGWDRKKACTTPIEMRDTSIKENKYNSWKELPQRLKNKAIHRGINPTVVHKRLQRGWPDELAVTKIPIKTGKGKKRGEANGKQVG